MVHWPAQDESDSDEEGSDSEESHQRRVRLRRRSSMLRTMFCATVRAANVVNAVRSCSFPRLIRTVPSGLCLEMDRYPFAVCCICIQENC